MKKTIFLILFSMILTLKTYAMENNKQPIYTPSTSNARSLKFHIAHYIARSNINLEMISIPDELKYIVDLIRSIISDEQMSKYPVILYLVDEISCQSGTPNNFQKVILNSLLNTALEKRSIEMAKTVLSLGASVNKNDLGDFLIEAASFGDAIFLQFLLDLGADINFGSGFFKCAIYCYDGSS